MAYYLFLTVSIFTCYIDISFCLCCLTVYGDNHSLQLSVMLNFAYFHKQILPEDLGRVDTDGFSSLTEFLLQLLFVGIKKCGGLVGGIAFLLFL